MRAVASIPLIVALAATPLACGTRKRSAGTADAFFAAPTELVASLVNPIEIALTWKDHATGEAGYFVEGYFFAGRPTGKPEFVIIDVLPPNATAFRHPKLLPETTFVYRVRPFFGKPSNVATLATGKEGRQQTPPAAAPSPTPGVVRRSLRSVLSEEAAAPTDLRAMLLPPAGVRLEWIDHAADEDAYLVEIQPGWGSEFQASALLEAHASSFTSYDFPTESRFSFRVRAFFYGQPSNEAVATTGIDPTLGPGAFTKVDPRESEKRARVTR